MPLAPGTRFGPYEVVSPLGAGGMGEVYRARDTRLGREVALKVLPPEMAGDPSRRQRFETEARAVAALSHPNIVAIHDVGEGYIISELVDGETLRTAKPGLRKTLDLAAQIAGGLACAHEAGIVHRDLKPENILVTRDGRAKILDFGLAKMQAARASTATATMTVHTEPGVVMGTVGYMSPEQVRGQTADHRSDIFSFGLILYELLAGRRAFAGDTSVETMTAILKQDTPDLPETVPAGVRQIVQHCLEKEPANRFQSARDLAFALTSLSQGSSASSAAIAARPTAWKWLRTALAAAALLALGIAAGWFLRRPAPPQQWNGVVLSGSEISTNARPSPDGHLVAFIAHDDDDVMQLWVMKPESGNRVMLTHRRDRGYANECSWSSDGSRIFYDRWYDQPNGVFSVPVLGGEEQLVLENAWTPEALPDGSLLVSQINPQHRQQVFRYWPDTGKSRAYPISPSGSYGPVIRAASDGRHALVVGSQLGEGADPAARIYILDLESGSLRALHADLGEAMFNQTTAAISRDGKTAFVATTHGNLTRIFSLATSGSAPARPLFSLTSEPLAIDVGADGAIYLDQSDRPLSIVRFSPEGGHMERLARVMRPSSDFIVPLPDGRVIWTEYAAGLGRLMIGEAGKEPAAFPSITEESAGPLAAVGAGDLAFMIGAYPRHTIAIAAVSTGRILHRIQFDKGTPEEMAASPDGKFLYWTSGGNIWSVPISGGEPRKLHAGSSVTVEPGGASLLVPVMEPPQTRLVRVPVKDGLPAGAEQEIPLSGSMKLGYIIDANSVRNGRLVAPGTSSRWYWPPAIFDLVSGKSARIPLDFVSDFHHMFWTADGKIIADAWEWRSTMWKFTPEKP